MPELRARAKSHDEHSVPSAFMAVLGVGQICSWGTLYYSFPLLAEAMRADLGWSRPALYGAASVGLVMAGFAAYPVGSAIDRGYGRLVMSSASVAAGLLLILWSQISDVWVFYLVFAAIGVAQAATLYEPAFAVIARRAGPVDARRAITILTLWGGFASTVFVPLTQLLLDQLGWRGTLVSLGMINIALCVAYFLSINPDKDHGAGIKGKDGAQTLQGLQALRTASTFPVFWMLMLAFTAYAAVFSAFTFHLYPTLLERGLGSRDTVLVIALIGPAQVIGRIMVWMLLPHAPVRQVGSAVVIAFPIAVLGIAFAPASVLVAATMAVLYGAANGIMTIVRGMAVPEMLTRKAYGAINGGLAAPSLLVQAAAPFGAAAVWSSTGSYEAVFLVIAAGSVLFAASFWIAAWLSKSSGPMDK